MCVWRLLPLRHTSGIRLWQCYATAVLVFATSVTAHHQFHCNTSTCGRPVHNTFNFFVLVVVLLQAANPMAAHAASPMIPMKRAATSTVTTPIVVRRVQWETV